MSLLLQSSPLMVELKFHTAVKLRPTRWSTYCDTTLLSAKYIALIFSRGRNTSGSYVTFP
jgi:hypothetical protein